MAGKVPCHCGLRSVLYVKDMTLESINDTGALAGDIFHGIVGFWLCKFYKP